MRRRRDRLAQPLAPSVTAPASGVPVSVPLISPAVAVAEVLVTVRAPAEPPAISARELVTLMVACDGALMATLASACEVLSLRRDVFIGGRAVGSRPDTIERAEHGGAETTTP